MEVQDLRIGNLTNFGKVYHIEIDVNNTSCFYVRDKDGVSYKNKWADIKPIPLTEDWLLKLGFEKDDYLWHNQIALYPSGEGFNYNAAFFEHDNLQPVNYVHTLQNLFFAITGVELISRD